MTRRGAVRIVVFAASWLAGLAAAGASPLAAEADDEDGCRHRLTAINRPVAPHDATRTATFVDPTATVTGARRVLVGREGYVAPFARLLALDGGRICIRDAANVQDNTVLRAGGARVDLGEEAIVAHGGRILADGTPASLGRRSACDPGTEELAAAGPHPDTLARRPGESDGRLAARRGRRALANALREAGVQPDCDEVASFIGFNALNRGHVADGALLAVAGRLGRGVVLRAGYSSLPGKSLDSQRAADDPLLGEVRYVAAGDVVFMNAVVHVNECLARGYARMFRADPSSVRGVNRDPGAFHGCEFNRGSERPRFAGHPLADPTPPRDVRVIGDVAFADRAGVALRNMDDRVSIRADEGEPFEFGFGVRWGRAATFHALEPLPEDPDVGVRVEDRAVVGDHVVIHGGGRRTRSGAPPDDRPTELDAGVVVESRAVVFRSDVGHGSRVGRRAVLVAYDNAEQSEQIPERCVKFTETPPGACAYRVEW